MTTITPDFSDTPPPPPVLPVAEVVAEASVKDETAGRPERHARGSRQAHMERLPWTCSVDQVLASWPKDRWLATLLSSGQGENDRWSIIAQPIAAVPVYGGIHQHKLLLHPRLKAPRDTSVPDDVNRPPFVGGWIASVRYELGGVIEPTTGVKPSGSDWNAVWFNCPSALCYDHQEKAWWYVHSARGADVTAEWPVYTEPTGSDHADSFTIGELSSAMGHAAYTQAVGKVLEHIAAGDVYQVNLTHTIGGSFSGSSRAMMLKLLRRAQPWYGSYVEYPLDAQGQRQAIASASPEMFISITRDGRITTRPMKGTRAGSSAAAELNDSEKERAELTMIVDLMRSDLGRVCVPGSVTVEQPRTIESHADRSILQATATVSGQLRRQTTFADILAATFPAGSVTGAPKVRAMQIIRELEPQARGQYCGCLGFVSDCGNAAFSVAIRTATVRGTTEGTLDKFAEGSTIRYGTGAGIVADSTPEAEWRESLDKAAVLLDVAGQSGMNITP